jgi:polyhydroxyalkanoate synthesis regulator phasin
VSPQPRKSSAGGARKPAQRRTAAKSSGARKSTARKPAAKARSAAKSTTARKSTARKSTARKTTARKAPAKRTTARRSSGQRMEFKNVAEFRDALRSNLIDPMELVMITRERIEGAVNEAVDRGRMTRKDAETLMRDIVEVGRKQTNDVLRDLEKLMNRGRSGLETRARRATKSEPARRARKQVRQASRQARKRVVDAADPLLAQADRARRAAGVGATFPITAYDELTTQQVRDRIGDLTPAELRKVRDYEKRNANRKTVLNAVEGRLA